MDNPTYEVTNENIYLIKNVLKPEKGDKIYSILGSGDIPFMFVDSGAQVLAVDNNQSQIDYVQSRLNAFDSGNLQKFRELGHECPIYYGAYAARDKFFQSLEVNGFFQKRNNLEMMFGDFFNLENVDFSKFNKVYLSNALDYYLGYDRSLFGKELIKKFDKFVDKFNPGTQFNFAYDYDLNYHNSLTQSHLVRELKSEVDFMNMDVNWDFKLFEKK